MIGPTAQGKSALMRQYIGEKEPLFIRTRSFVSLSFSIATNGRILQNLMEKNFVKLNKNLIRPLEDKHQIFFFDDLNMARKDKWKISSACELLRQFFDYGGWYNLEKIYFKKVKDVNFVMSISSRSQKKLLVDERVGWHGGAIGVINFQGCHIE